MYPKNEEMPHAYLSKPFDGRPATWGKGSHIAFLAETRAEVDASYRAAMDFGGLDEGARGSEKATPPIVTPRMFAIRTQTSHKRFATAMLNEAVRSQLKLPSDFFLAGPCRLRSDARY